jgi:hypothetical protein
VRGSFLGRTDIDSISRAFGRDDQNDEVEDNSNTHYGEQEDAHQSKLEGDNRQCSSFRNELIYYSLDADEL